MDSNDRLERCICGRSAYDGDNCRKCSGCHECCGECSCPDEERVITNELGEAVSAFLAEQGCSSRMLKIESEALWLMTRFADRRTVDLTARLEAAEKERDKWRLALEGLTPQGSEYYNDIKRCVDYVVDRLASDHKRTVEEVKRRVAAEKENAGLRAEVERLKDVLHRDQTGLADGLADIRKAVKGWAWILTGEWGSYDYTQQTAETMRREFSNCLREIEVVAKESLTQSGNLAHRECCGRNHEH